MLLNHVIYLFIIQKKKKKEEAGQETLGLPAEPYIVLQSPIGRDILHIEEALPGKADRYMQAPSMIMVSALQGAQGFIPHVP